MTLTTYAALKLNTWSKSFSKYA